MPIHQGSCLGLQFHFLSVDFNYTGLYLNLWWVFYHAFTHEIHQITSSTQQKHIKNHHKTRPPQYGRHDLPVPPSHIVVVGHLLLCGADDLFRTQSQGFQLSAQAWTVRSWLSEGRKNLHFCRKITIKWPQKAASGDSSSRLAQGLLIWFLASQDHTQETNVTTGLQGSFEDSFDGSVGLRYLPPL